MSSSSDTPPAFSGIPDDYWDWQIQFDAFLICKDINNLSETRPDAEAAAATWDKNNRKLEAYLTRACTQGAEKGIVSRFQVSRNGVGAMAALNL